MPKKLHAGKPVMAVRALKLLDDFLCHIDLGRLVVWHDVVVRSGHPKE
jgi:hypothetical protein